ncbi:NlpC/P60 family protein [Ligilactobacillus salivarius]|uniref:NlpC/P60 domain-containing protein n=1 Tax=Ligilactobacillus salivarius TaxID=1624 RepID=A0A1V9REE6_9LACO|nr:phage tail protein [Ligilactobacillus salivarius]OQQ91361.1 hypothetical protein B6U56_02830 [Ligilactobacillus salivarius]
MLAGGYLVTFKSNWNDGEVILNGPNVGYNNRLLTASVTKDISSYDSFEFSILPNHKNYNDLNLFNTFIKVYRPIENDKLIFEGRIINISDSMDSSGVLSKVVTCEGLEGFLHDSMQLFGEYHDMSPKDFLQKLIDIHNTQVDSFKKITLGTVNVTNSTDNVYRYTEDDKDTYDTIQDKLVNRLGGEIKIRHENGQLILDYVQRNGKQSLQGIVLAKNLLSLTRNINIEDFWTVLKPLGASIDRNNPNGDYTDANTAIPRVTIKDVNNGSMYIKDESMVKEFGIIVKQKTWDDVTDPKNLLLRGQNEVKNHSAFSLQLQVSYVDLAYINPEKFATLNCGDDVRVTSVIQGIDFNQRISSMTIDLLELSNSSITLAPQSLNITSYDVMLQKQALADKNMIEHIEYANKQNKIVISTLKNDINKLIEENNQLRRDALVRQGSGQTVAGGPTEPVNGDWGPVIKHAARLMNVQIDDSGVNLVKAQINLESSGNEKALGGDDGLSDGRASGLLQFKPGTFNHYALNGHKDIWKGFDQLLAFFNIPNALSQITGTHGWSPSGSPRYTDVPNKEVSGGAKKLQDTARKYLGVPYVWGGAGGARGGNPYSGMDCSSFVSQVYKDLGINIPAYTVDMERYGHQISRSEVQAGDMGFYGNHGASYHITLALDNKRMIYEPVPGQSCMEQDINAYPPTWWIRNDNMARIVAGG